jgi:hypothetical protein
VTAIKLHKLSSTLTHHLSQCITHEVVNLNTLFPVDKEDREEKEIAKVLIEFIFQQTNVKVSILSYGPCAKNKHMMQYPF